jgi:hypothetical protein
MTDIPTTPAPPKAHAEVMYYSGVTIMSGTPAVVEWGADDRIRMWTVVHGAPPVLVFDAAPSEITVKGPQTVLNLVVGGRPHRIDFASGTGAAIRGFGVAGMIGSQVLTDQLGLPQWIEALRAAGATVQYRRAWVSVLIAVGIVVAVFVIIGVILAVTAFN